MPNIILGLTGKDAMLMECAWVRKRREREVTNTEHVNTESLQKWKVL